MLNDDVLTNDELREFEAQVDERFKAIASRFIMTDERFIGLGERLDRIAQDLQALARRSEGRCKEIERRIHATQTHAHHVRVQLASSIEAARRDLARVLVLGVIVTVASTALLCLPTLLLVL